MSYPRHHRCLLHLRCHYRHYCRPYFHLPHERYRRHPQLGPTDRARNSICVYDANVGSVRDANSSNQQNINKMKIPLFNRGSPQKRNSWATWCTTFGPLKANPILQFHDTLYTIRRLLSSIITTVHELRIWKLLEGALVHIFKIVPKQPASPPS